MNSNDLKLFKLPEWFDKINSADSVMPLAYWDGILRHYLEPLEEGAILCWTFSNPVNPVAAQLFVRLTEEEAQKVAATDLREVGILEEIRSTLADTEALVFTFKDGDENSTGVMPFRIRRDTGEESFSRSLDSAALFPSDWWTGMKQEAEQYIAEHQESGDADHATSDGRHLCNFHLAEERLREIEDMPKRLHASA